MFFWKKYDHIIYAGILGCVLSFIAFSVTFDWARKKARNDFQRIAWLEVMGVEDNILDHLSFVRSLGALQNVSDKLEEKTFLGYVRSFVSENSSLNVLMWLPKIKRTELSQHIKGADHVRDYSLKERNDQGKFVKVSEREEYYPIYFASYENPEMEKIFPRGVDLSSVKLYRKRFAKARDSGNLILKKGDQFLNKKGYGSKYLTILPVYGGGFLKPVDIQERRDRLVGYVVGVEDLGDIVEKTIKKLFVTGINFSLYDLSSGVIPELVYVHQSRLQGNNVLGHYNLSRKEPSFEEEFNAGGRKWLLVAKPEANYFVETDAWAAWVVLVGGLFVTFMFSVYLFGLVKQAEKTEDLVKERTVELFEKNNELKHYSDALTRSNEELQQFAYIASHDLQEPLRMVTSFTELLKKKYGEKLDSQANDYMDFAVAGVKRMRQLINDLLAYSQVEAADSDMQVVSMVEVVEWAISNLQASIQECQAEVHHVGLPEVTGVQSLLQRLMQNIISNSIKYRSQERLLKIDISAEKQEKQWLFSMTDNGIGVDSKYYERVFAIFQRLHTREEYSGTGVGLAICKKIIKTHRGRIWIEPGLDNIGITVNFTLPL